jgi:predicted metalloprotease with PDZ domain
MISLLPLAAAAVLAQGSEPIILQVNASEAGRNIIHVLEMIPAKPGPLLLRYPKWIPGEHQPSGTLQNVINLHVRADGKEIPWRRDPVEMFDIRVDVPKGAKQVQVTFDDGEQPGNEFTSRLGRLKWNRVIFVPKGSAEQVQVRASLRAPAGWTVFNALPVKANGDVWEFPQVSAERLVDSPVMMGLNAKSIPLSSTEVLDMVGDEPKNLNPSDATIQIFKNLVEEARSLFGARHYRTYHLLASFSSYGAWEGLEHNECSEDGSGADDLTSDVPGVTSLFSHELTHSWNGKYRRPSDLYQADFATAQGGSLLWVYEGMTQYWGVFLAARSGGWTFDKLKSTIADTGVYVGFKTGRTWRSTADTAAAASILRGPAEAWSLARRSQDYYSEGLLLWLGIDATLRKLTNNGRSLDDFCRLFAGGRDTGPMIQPYTLQDVVKWLNLVAPYDWSAYFQKHVYSVHPGLPIEGIEAAGYRLVFKNTPGGAPKAATGKAPSGASHRLDLGISVGSDGAIKDVGIGMAADMAGLGPGMKILTIGDRPYSDENLNQAIEDAMGDPAPIRLQVTKDGVVSSISVDYHEGLQFPMLEQIPGAKDYLAEIAKPLRRR